MNQNYDVAIIGGGIIGSSIALHLAKEENLKIVLINSNNLGNPASVAAAGLLTPFHLNKLENPLLKDFSLRSFEYFPRFLENLECESTESNIDLGFRLCGSLYLIFSNFEIAQKENEVKSLKTFDNGKSTKATYINKQDVLKLEPKLAKDILGAYHHPQEGYINNIKLLKSITQYCLNKKVSYINNEVKEINISKNNVQNISLCNGEIIQADKYILCNGTQANLFLNKIFNTNEVLLKAIKGEILQIGIEAELPIQKIIICNEGYMLPRPATNHLEKNSIIVGSTSEEINEESNLNIFENSVQGISYLTNLFQKLLPECKNYKIRNMWSGLRPKFQDSLPAISKMREIENLYCALGHYRNGILTGPYTGKIIKDILLGDKPDFNIDPFNINRFTVTKHSQPTAGIKK